MIFRALHRICNHRRFYCNPPFASSSKVDEVAKSVKFSSNYQWVGGILVFASSFSCGWFAASLHSYGPRYSGAFSRIDEAWSVIMSTAEDVYRLELERQLGGQNDNVIAMESDLTCLDWLVIGTHYRTISDFGFAYHCYYLAHMKSEGRLGNVVDLCINVSDFEESTKN